MKEVIIRKKNKLIKFMKKNNNEVAGNYIKTLMNKIESDNKTKKEMLEDDSYLKWVEIFTLNVSCFSTETYLYNEQLYTIEEKKNIDNIVLLYEIVEKYAKENYIPANNLGNHYYYSIKYNEKIYNVGIVRCQGNFFYLEKAKEKEKYIEYQDIKTNKKQKRTFVIEKKLEILKGLITDMYINGIRPPIITNTVEETIKELTKTKKN